MKEYEMSINITLGNIKAKDEEEATLKLYDQIERNNDKAENIFWENLKLTEVKKENENRNTKRKKAI